MRERVSDDADQGSKPEDHVTEVNKRGMREQIRLERPIEVEKNKKDDDRDDPNPELLLFGGIVSHIRRLVVRPGANGRSFPPDVKTRCPAAGFGSNVRWDGTS
jgi:hypothetical protein